MKEVDRLFTLKWNLMIHTDELSFTFSTPAETPGVIITFYLHWEQIEPWYSLSSVRSRFFLESAIEQYIWSFHVYWWPVVEITRSICWASSPILMCFLFKIVTFSYLTDLLFPLGVGMHRLIGYRQISRFSLLPATDDILLFLTNCTGYIC